MHPIRMFALRIKRSSIRHWETKGLKLLAVFAFSIFLLSGCSEKNTNGFSDAKATTADGKTSALDLCPAAGMKSGGSNRRMALIIGVGEYLNTRVPDLVGPTNDAKRMYDLLTNRDSFAFPAENICLLLDENATLANTKEQFQRFLIDDARKDDVVVFYFAGHGSQVRDVNFDEADGMDETFMLHDSRATREGKKVPDLNDDIFNGLLARLHQKTKNITVILDSCNSGSAMRSNSEFVSRFFEPDSSPTLLDTSASDSSEVWAPESLPGLVTLTAAVDGTPALERAGKGIFTDALIQVLSQWRGEAPSYRQLVYQALPIIKGESYQTPQANGDLDRILFGAKKPLFPNTWHVTESANGELRVSGAPLPGLGLGARLTIYDGAITSARALQPDNAKAVAQISEFDGLSARASVIYSASGAAAITAGDFAVLSLPSLAPMTVSLHPSLANTTAAKEIKRKFEQEDRARDVMRISDKGEFEVQRSRSGDFEIKGPENRIRSRYKDIEDVFENLILHAKQRAIFQLKGEIGSSTQDKDWLQVQLIPSKRQDRCAKQGSWKQADANALQVIPLCYRWNIQVSLDKDVEEAMNVGGVILSSDGSIYGFPADGRVERLEPGDTLTFSGRNETFKATPPIEVEDTVIVFGTRPGHPVAWHQLTQTARSAGNVLQNLVSQYINSPLRGVQTATEIDTESAPSWTRSMVRARVEANTYFTQDDNSDSDGKINFREYTISNFDIRPYLPDDHSHPLYKVLQQADALARSANSDGIPYKQHTWSQGSDAANLAVGIDCSRAIWFAFTRAQLPYNERDNAYLATADMVTDKTAMKDRFSQCPTNQRFQLGDVLVYRDDGRGDGHVVMVIDPEKRIAWGSHGWDGNSRLMPVEPDTGVEYQLIKIKKDWQKWDRSTMNLKKCWRYKAFSKLPPTGTTALKSSCSASSCQL